MLNRISVERLDDFFTDLPQRKSKGVYFYRFNGFDAEIHDFVRKYHEAARTCGVIIEGKLGNPDNNMIAYYSEIMGMDFRLDRSFLIERLRKWLPRMSDAQRENVGTSIYNVLQQLSQSGKNENMLKNIYIKFMCWMYYRLERIIHQLGNNKLPKILYEGEITYYELLLLNVICLAGSDIVLLQYKGDAEYLKIDAASAISQEYKKAGLKPFPADFSLKKIRQEIQDEIRRESLYGTRPQLKPCVNAWASGKVFDDLRKPPAQRGTDGGFFYSCFCRVSGAEDKVNYVNDLYKLQLDLKNAGRKLLILSGSIPDPAPEEIAAVRRNQYQKPEQIVMDLSANFRTAVEPELQKLFHCAFVDIIFEEAAAENKNIHQLTTQAVYLICWFKRYHEKLFHGWKYPDIPVFFYLGGCRNENEAMFCRFLSKLPVDVVIFKPDLNKQCVLESAKLMEVHYTESLPLDSFPEEQQGLRAGTSAYHAERELDTLMYEDSGMYRNQQYDKANVITLQTMYEEIAILWAQELKYRPHFSTADGTVNMPVLFSKISGVKDGDVSAYWHSVKSLITPDTLVISRFPYIAPNMPNNMKQFVPEFIRNGKVLRTKIKNHPAYPYGILRDSMQDYILDKMQLLIDQKIIKGTFENGMEYNIAATVLNLDTQTVRLIQKFDFTKQNPKVIFICTNESRFSVEDAIYFSFLNQIGFDILFFIPTGYQCYEMHLNKCMIEEHQIGEYLYDLRVPNFPAVQSGKHKGFIDKIFKRGS